MSKNRQKPSKRDQAVALYRKGLTQRVIADRVGVSRATVQRWLARARDEGVRLPTPARGRPRKRASKASKAPAPSPEADGSVDRLLEQLAQLPEGDALREIGAIRLPQIRETADRAHAEGNLPLFRDAVKLEIDLTQKLEAAIPPPPPDPQEDPANLDARRDVISKLEALANKQSDRILSVACPDCARKLRPLVSGPGGAA